MSWRAEIEEAVAGREAGRSGHIRVNCPACEYKVGKADYKSSVSINLANGWYKCWRCDWRGRLPGYGIDDDERGEDDGWEDVEEQEEILVEAPSDYRRLPGASFLLQPANEYLARRGVPVETVVDAELGFAVHGEHAGRIIFPCHGPEEGVWLGWVGRAIDERKYPKYWTAAGMNRAATFYNHRALEGPADRILFLGEGPHDAIRRWPDGVAGLGKPTLDHIEQLKRCKRPIAVVLDGDSWREGLGVAQVLRAAKANAFAIALPPGVDLDTANQDLVSEAALWAFTHGEDADIRHL